MDDGDDSAAPSREEVELFELSKQARWEEYPSSGYGQIGLLVAFAQDLEKNFLFRAEQHPRLRTYYASLFQERDRVRALLADLALRFNPRFACMEPLERLSEPDDLNKYVRPMSEHLPLPQQMLERLAGAMPPMPSAPAQPDRSAAVPGNERVACHKTKTRSDVLTLLIGRSMQSADGLNDYHGGWTRFVAFAQDKVSPLLGYILEDESVKYLDGGRVKFLTKDAYRKRVKPSAR